MKHSFVASLALGAVMLLSAGLAKVATPTVRIADSRPRIDLAASIPVQFGNWEEDRALLSAVVNPTAQAEIQRIYAQTLSRTYVNRNGERIMLSIAYGTDQTDGLSVHFPEGCYGGQGFAVGATTLGPLATSAGPIPSARLVASMYNRNEPITYWIVVGDKAVNDSWQMKKAKLAYALKGLIPDATLMRVSSITADNAAGYKLQQEFISEMMAAMTPEQRHHFAGLAQ
ncbi:exosortase-associated protein EpsI, B-type [Janthinobacterium fluminis]|uniref:EpsI family protein n=1 Tax=Janthinobacterium fluminis TaxID=2987524 RepID=A0ABT5JXZ7_9BURK|nr:exosortase-associated protein EpsI, B-type [Janthinobacterium fluminis]MDC8757606.1 EpsI family protein [Janthinobacterium fluminis]